MKIACPTLALWGADYYAVGKLFDMLQVWAEMAGDLRTHAIPQCGHLPQEEQPEIVNRLLLDFLEGWIGGTCSSPSARNFTVCPIEG